MRIINGLYKGKTFNFIKNLKTRPLKNIVRESIFNVLKHSSFINVKINDSNVLDLYSGIGSFGLECLSRGSKKVVFIEQDKIAADILKNNLNLLSGSSKFEVINNKIENVLENEDFIKFNIFFLDPPFKENNFIKILAILRKRKIFEKKHIVIIHREKKTKENLEKSLKILVTRNYGRSKIIFGTFN